MPLNASQLLAMQESALDFYIREKVAPALHDVDRPLLKGLNAKMRTFSGGGADRQITAPARWETQTTHQAFEFDDLVTYSNPSPQRALRYQWRQIHWGIEITETELQMAGVTVSDDMNAEMSGDEFSRIQAVLETKMADMELGVQESLESMYWLDGTQNPKEPPGVMSLVHTNPSAPAYVGGVDQSTNAIWRNRASLGINVSTPSDLKLTSKLRSEELQLRKYRGRPTHRLCGSAFMDALWAEISSKGTFTQTGWAGSAIDIGIEAPKQGGTSYVYEPFLDTLGLEKYCYVLDVGERGIYPMVMRGQNLKRRTPIRPNDKYVYMTAITHTFAMVCRNRNSSGVYSIA